MISYFIYCLFRCFWRFIFINIFTNFWKNTVLSFQNSKSLKFKFKLKFLIGRAVIVSLGRNSNFYFCILCATSNLNLISLHKLEQQRIACFRWNIHRYRRFYIFLSISILPSIFSRSGTQYENVNMWGSSHLELNWNCNILYIWKWPWWNQNYFP